MVRILKLVIFIVAIIGGLGEVVNSQNIDSIRYTGTYENVGIVEFLRILERQYPITFYFKDEWFAEEKISADYNNIPLNIVLDKVIEAKPYIYETLQGSMVVFMPKDEVALITGKMIDVTREINDLSLHIVGNPNEAGKHKEVQMKGIVRDGKTGEALTGATIHIENTNYGVVSNLKGEYSIVLKPGIYILIASNIGFEKALFKVKIISNGSLDIELFEESIKIDEVSIYAQRADKNVRSSQMSIVELDAKMIKQLPSITGEKDILKSLTLMPGVKSVGEFGSGINVRGGGEDQNLYLIEGTPIFNTSHVLGLLSVINPDAVTGLTLYKGHIPAGFGERVSSVIDVQLKDNNSKTLHSKGGIGLYNSRLMLEGPVYKDKLTFKLGGRTSYSDFLLTRIPDYYLQNSSASFYDINGLLKLNIKNNWFTLFGYTSNDRFRYASDLEYQYGNQLVSMNWGHFYNHNLNSVITLSNSQYNVFKDKLKPEYEESRTKSQINYSNAKLNFAYSGIAKHNIDGGIQGIFYAIQPGERFPLRDTSLITRQELSSEQAFESALYLNDLFDVTNQISINAGLRFSTYFYLGPHILQQYQKNAPISPVSIIDTANYKKGEIIKFYQGLEPRFSIKFQFNDKNSLKMSYNRNKQYISLISYTSISTPDDVWKLSDTYFQPIMADQLAVGYYRNFLDNSIETSVEIYYKNLSHLLEYKNGAQLEMNQNIETELTDASGKNYGIEFLIKKNKGKVDGWISYAYSRTFISTQGNFQEEIINRNEFYSSSYDKPHDLTILATYHINRRWRISGNFMFASGRSVTFPEYKFTSGKNEIIYYSDRNKYRLPPYHRFDFSISMDESLRIKKKWKGSWTFSVLNVYARKNAYTVFYKKEYPTLVNDFRSYSLYKLFIIGKPLPTLTYNFIF